MSLSMILATVITILTSIFLGDKIWQRIAPPAQMYISVTLISLLVTLSAYNLTVNLLSLRKGNPTKGGME
jgi:hypothetical protein